MISSEDEQSASEIYAAEALVRYMSGMFYALVLAFLLILVTVIFRYIVFGQAAVGLIIMLCAYLFAIGAILSRFRFMRTKEVETVFAASFKNRSVFEEETTLEARSAPPTCVLGSSQALLGIFLAGLLGFVAGNRLRRP